MVRRAGQRRSRRQRRDASSTRPPETVRTLRQLTRLTRMATVPISEALNVPLPPLRPPERRHSKASSVSSRDFSPATRATSRDEQLRRLILDEDYFGIAVDTLDLLLIRRANSGSRCVQPRSSAQLEEELLRPVLESDVYANFHHAAGAPVLQALRVLQPGFSAQAGDGKTDVTDVSWLFGEHFLLNVEYKTE